MAQLPVNIVEQLTQTEWDNQDTQQIGSLFLNSTDDTLQYKPIGAGTETIASESFVTSGKSLQSSYDGGNTITLAASTPVEFIGIDNTDPSTLNLYTPQNSPADTTGQLLFLGDNDNVTPEKTIYSLIKSQIIDPTDGDEKGFLSLSVIEDGVLSQYIGLEGESKEVIIFRHLELLDDLTVVGTPITAPATINLHTPTATLGVNSFLNFRAANDLSATLTYASIEGHTVDDTAGAEIGSIKGIVKDSGADVEYLILDGANREVKILNSTSKTLDTAATLSDIPAGSLLNVQTFTASGTYTPTVGATKAIVYGTGGGAGGGGSGSSGATDGGDGVATTFGAIATANGGAGGGAGSSTTSGEGGTGGNSTGGTQNMKGGGGGTGYITGGPGGMSFYGGAGRARGSGTKAGIPGAANTGSGGSGGTFTSFCAGSGGAGATFMYFYDPVDSQTVTIGGAGTAGTAGTSGNVGGSGGSGICVIYEYS